MKQGMLEAGARGDLKLGGHVGSPCTKDHSISWVSLGAPCFGNCQM